MKRVGRADEDATARNERIRSSRDEIRKLAELAREYWLDDKTLQEIDVSISRAGRRLKLAQEKGVLAFDIDPSFGFRGKRDIGLGRRLATEFELESAVVVHVDLLDTDDRDESHSEDDFLHTVLANQAGEYLCEKIASGDHIAVSGGRAIYQLARFIRRMPLKGTRRDLQITAISGRVWAHFWQLHGPTIRRPVDADDAAFVLASTFAEEPGTRFNRVDHALFAKNHPAAREAMQRTHVFLPDGTWHSGNAPTKAIVGVGSLDPAGGHRFADLYRSASSDDVTADLRKAAKELHAIIEFVQQHGLESPGDVANRLFAAVPLPDAVVPTSVAVYSKAYDKLAAMLARINDRMVVIDWSHLRGVPTIVVAGGRYKLSALWTLLIAGALDSRRQPMVTELCIDAESAVRLLDAKARFQSAEHSVKAWYQARVNALFP